MTTGVPIMNKITAVLALCALPLMACFGGGKSSKPECEANLKYTKGNYSKDKPFKGWGTGKTKERAEENACWNYCYEADGDFDAKYQVWLDSSEGKKHAKKKAPKKEMAITLGKSLRKQFDGCVSTCQKNAAAEKKGLSVDAKCGG